MHKNKIWFTLVLMLMVAVLAILCAPEAAKATEEKHPPVEVVILTGPFGAGSYNYGFGLEDISRRHPSWLTIRAQETPGGTYMIKYWIKNRKAMLDGTISQIALLGVDTALVFLAEGRPPFTKLALPFARVWSSAPGLIDFFATFDPNIKTLKDLTGKKVAVALKSQIFQTGLRLKPYFDKGLGIWDQVDWQYLGYSKGKDALLNGQIDACIFSCYGSVKAEGGILVSRDLAPSPAGMEILGAGRKVHLIGWDPEVTKASYDFSTDVRILPVLVKKGAMEQIDKDVWVNGTTSSFYCDESMPEDVVIELLRIMTTYHDELAQTDATAVFFSKNPYPVGVPKRLIHPAVFKAAKVLHFDVPKE